MVDSLETDFTLSILLFVQERNELSIQLDAYMVAYDVL